MPPRSVLAGHFDHVGGGVADGVEVSEQGIEIEGFAAAEVRARSA
jgi:hypothetical protein